MTKNLVTIKEYALINNKSVSAVRKKAQRCKFQTSIKIGRDWFIDPNEEYVDYRYTIESNT